MLRRYICKYFSLQEISSDNFFKNIISAVRENFKNHCHPYPRPRSTSHINKSPIKLVRQSLSCIRSEYSYFQNMQLRISHRPRRFSRCRWQSLRKISKQRRLSKDVFFKWDLLNKFRSSKCWTFPVRIVRATMPLKKKILLSSLLLKRSSYPSLILKRSSYPPNTFTCFGRLSFPRYAWRLETLILLSQMCNWNSSIHAYFWMWNLRKRDSCCFQTI